MERSMLGLSGYCLISAAKTTLIFGEGGGEFYFCLGNFHEFAADVFTNSQLKFGMTFKSICEVVCVCVRVSTKGTELTCLCRVRKSESNY